MADLGHLALEQALRRKIRRPLFATLGGDHLAAWPDPSSRYAVSGAMLLPIREVLGLRPAAEVKERQLEVEGRTVHLTFRDLRSHLDHLARPNNTALLEELYSPIVIIGGPVLDRVKQVARGFTNRQCYHDFMARADVHRRLAEGSHLPVRHLLEASRLYLAGTHLLTHGMFDSSLETLLERYEAYWLRPFLFRQRSQGDAAVLEPDEARLLRGEVAALESQLHAAHARSPLPEGAGSVTALDELLIEMRLADAREVGA